MAQVSTSDFRGGMKVEMEGQPFVIVTNEFVKPGKGQSFNRVRLKHLVSGKVVDKTFKSGEKLELADIDEKKMRMLYADQDGVVFMDDESYEQITIDHNKVGETKVWLVEDEVYDIIFYKGEALTLEPPTFMELEVTDTAPGVRGDTASGRVLKPATLSTGATVQVPIFVDQGEKIKVDTRTNEYVSRVS